MYNNTDGRGMVGGANGIERLIFYHLGLAGVILIET
jgi:hypothetical protein